MMDRELFARNIINIIDVKHCTEYSIFMGDDLFEQLLKYLKKLAPDVIKDIDVFMAGHEQTIKKVIANKQIDIYEYNQFMNDLKAFKKNNIMKSKHLD